MLCISSLVVAAVAGAPQKLQGGASQALFPVLSVPLLSGPGRGASARLTPPSRPAGVHLHGPPALHATVRGAPAGSGLTEGRRGHRAGQCGCLLTAGSGAAVHTLCGWRRLAAASGHVFPLLGLTHRLARGSSEVCCTSSLAVWSRGHAKASPLPLGGQERVCPVGPPRASPSSDRRLV